MEGAIRQTDTVGVQGCMPRPGCPDWAGHWGPLFTPATLAAAPGWGHLGRPRAWFVPLIVSLELCGSPVLQQRRMGGTGGPPGTGLSEPRFLLDLPCRARLPMEHFYGRYSLKKKAMWEEVTLSVRS